MPRVHLVCLDFDGTVMAYDEKPGFLHPAVVEVLNGLKELDIAWCTNSGRGEENQRQILDMSAARGLKHLPAALLCGESLIFKRRGAEYLPSEPWNSAVRRHLRSFHRRVQHLIKGKLEDWTARYQPTVYTGEEYTTLLVGEEENKPERLFGELRKWVLASVPRSMVSRNGGWMTILPDHLGKGRVLETYVGGSGFSREETLAVGDHFNDISMLDGSAVECVGCPGDAIPDVIRAVSDAGGYVAQAGGPEGAVEVIRHFLEDEPPEGEEEADDLDAQGNVPP
jgi:hydroxymethylpyrimidine pyrophosphatase-like HAD family hydrolase